MWQVSGPELALSSSLMPFAVLTLFLVIIRVNPLFSKRQNAALVIAVLVNLFMILVTATDFVISSARYPDLWMLRRCTTFLNFAGAPLVPLLLYQLHEDTRRRLIFYAPALLNFALCAVSILSGTVFYISSENDYARGPLFFIPFCFTLFYIATIFIKPAKGQMESKRVERLLLAIIIGFILLCMYLEIIGQMRMLLWNCSAVGLMLYYLLLNIHSFALDPLTRANNRLMYNRALENMRGATPYLLALIDINDFKQVNDTRGHAAGDRCLIDFAGILNRCFLGCATLYRIGGDEFALLSEGRGREKFSDCLAQARQEAARQDIRFACGMAEYDGTGDIEPFLHQIDRLMYEDKANLKQG